MAHPATSLSPQAEPALPRWNPATAIAFRFVFSYAVLYTLPRNPLFELLGMAFGWIPGAERLLDFITTYPFWPLFELRTWSRKWAALHVLHMSVVPRPPIGQSGSGDTLFVWTQILGILLAAAVATAVWSLADRKRSQYVRLHRWFILYLRFVLAGYMFTYGAMKILPDGQFPYPDLNALLTPVGQMTPMHLFWVTMGYSARYKLFAGSVEMLGGLLLIVPRTALLGSLVCLGSMTNVFVINLSYDVPVKILSFHLLLISAVLAAPAARRLADFFVLHRAVDAAPPPPLFRRRWLQLGLVGLQIAFGLALAATTLLNTHRQQVEYSFTGGTSLQGQWLADAAPAGNPAAAWRQVVFDTFRGPEGSPAHHRINVTFADGSRQTYLASIGPQQDSLRVWKQGVRRPRRPQLRISQTGPNTMAIDGTLDGTALHLTLHRQPLPAFTLDAFGFQWVSEYPRNVFAEH